MKWRSLQIDIMVGKLQLFVRLFADNPCLPVKWVCVVFFCISNNRTLYMTLGRNHIPQRNKKSLKFFIVWHKLQKNIYTMKGKDHV